jgi:2-haloacid dehalogenase
VVSAVRAVVFDVGGVLVDWDPRHLYRKLIADENTMEHFLQDVCSLEWHAQHDQGLAYSETIPTLVEIHPEWKSEIEAWELRFAEMWAGPIAGSVALLEEVRRRGFPTFASTNWGAEAWQLARNFFPYLSTFDGALVSGEVGLIKPDPRFFALLIERFRLVPEETLYIEDTLVNLEAAERSGFVVHHFRTPDLLEDELARRGVIDR